MASKKRGKGYQGRVDVNRYKPGVPRRNIYRTFPSDRQRRDWEIGEYAKLERGEEIDKPADPTTVIEYARRWVSLQTHHRESTHANYRTSLNRLEGSTIGMSRLTQVKRSEVQTWVNGMVTEGLAHSTIGLEKTFLGMVFTAAVLDGDLPYSPVIKIVVGGRKPKEKRVLTSEHLQLLADTIRPNLRALVIVKAGCGERISELFGLREEHINWAAREITISGQRGKYGKKFVEPKTDAGYRVVKVPEPALIELSEHMRRFPPVGGWVFTNTVGEPYHYSDFHRYGWGRAVRACHTADPTFPKALRPHELRHTFFSWGAADGVNPAELALAGGQRDGGKLAQQTYIHPTAGGQDRLQAAMARRLRGENVGAADEAAGN